MNTEKIEQSICHPGKGVWAVVEGPTLRVECGLLKCGTLVQLFPLKIAPNLRCGFSGHSGGMYLHCRCSGDGNKVYTGIYKELPSAFVECASCGKRLGVFLLASQGMTQ